MALLNKGAQLFDSFLGLFVAGCCIAEGGLGLK